MIVEKSKPKKCNHWMLMSVHEEILICGTIRTIYDLFISGVRSRDELKKNRPRKVGDRI